jgi:CRISPR-associated protein (TIGR03986 family)
MEQAPSQIYTPLMKGGYIQKRGSEWVIQPAQEIDHTTFAAIPINDDLFGRLRPVNGTRNSFEIFIQTGKYDYQPVKYDPRTKRAFLYVRGARVLHAQANPSASFRPAVLVKSGPMESKRSEAVIYPCDENADPLELDDDLVEAYRDQISKEQEKILGKNGVLVDGHPVFYIQNDSGKVIAVGHCRMLRIPYPLAPKDLLPRVHREERKLDLAEAIFGYARRIKKNEAPLRERSFAGRVFFSNACLVEDQTDIWLARGKTVTPKVLGGPKPTTFQHYLVQTEPDRYQMGQTRDGKPKWELRLADYASHGKTTLRGSKLYWHKGPVGLDDIQKGAEDPGKENVLTQIQPLRAGVRFKFRIDFENLAREELGALAWVLNIASQDGYRLKLGMGKPLGLGAVAINSNLRLIDRYGRYRKLWEGEGFHLAERSADGELAKLAVEFERFILQALGSRAARLAEVERIRDLLLLLSFPGPHPAHTRYLEISRRDPQAKHGKRNEYRERPVLPTPYGVWTMPAPGGSATGERPPVNASTSSSPGEEWTGVVKKYGLGNKGDYGFIVYRNEQGNEVEIYVNRRRLASGLERLERGQTVIFKIGTGFRGDPEAQDVRLADSRRKN